MFKKFVSIILCFVLVLSFVGCGKADSGAESNITTDAPAADPVQSAPEEVTEAPTEETVPQVIDTDENLLTVDITFPASFFEGTDMSTFDADAYAKEQGFISAKVNDDGSMVVTMSKKKHAELVNETAASLDTNFAKHRKFNIPISIHRITSHPLRRLIRGTLPYPRRRIRQIIHIIILLILCIDNYSHLIAGTQPDNPIIFQQEFKPIV